MNGIQERLTFTFGRAVSVPAPEARRGARALDGAAVAAAVAPTERPEEKPWGYLGLFMFTAVLLMRPQDRVPVLSPFHLAELFAFVGVIPMFAYRFTRGLPVVRFTPELIALLVFGAAILGTAPFSVWPGGAINTFTNEYVKVIVVFLLMVNTLTTTRRVERIVMLMIVCCGYISMLAIWGYMSGIVIEGERLNGPLDGMFLSPNDLALFLVTFLPATVTTSLTRHYSTTRRITAGAIGAAMLVTIILTKSRGGTLGLVAMLPVLIFFGRKIRRGFAAVALIVVFGGLPLLPPSFVSRMATIFDAKKDHDVYTGSRESRRIIMLYALHTFMAHPLTGVGAGQFRNYNPPDRVQERWMETHNALLQAASETGIVGLLAFSFLIFRAGKASAATRRLLLRVRPARGSPRGRSRAPTLALEENERDALYAHGVAMTAGLVGWFVCALFASVAYSWTFYYLLAMTVAGHELIKSRLVYAPRSGQRTQHQGYAA
jgi:putative inorganic carbon (HCO3(-)) transporter